MNNDSKCAYKFKKTLEILKESISERIKKWKQESKRTIFVHFIYIVLIIEQNRANRAWHISSERVRAKFFSSNIEFEPFSSKIFSSNFEFEFCRAVKFSSEPSKISSKRPLSLSTRVEPNLYRLNSFEIRLIRFENFQLN